MWGSTNAAAAPGDQFIVSDDSSTLAPGEFIELPLVFGITQAGRLSHTVSATADNAVRQSETAWVTVEGTGTSSTTPPSLRVTMVGPVRHTVGEVAQFRITVENTGNVPARNVVVSSDRDGQLKAVQIDRDKPYDEAEFLRSELIVWRTAEIAPRASETYLFAAECTAPAQQACARVEVTADGLQQKPFDQQCLEIRPPRGSDGVVAPPLGSSPPVSPPSSGFEITITEPNLPRVGDRFIVFVQLKNNTGSAQQNVQLRVLIPPLLRGDFAQVQSQAATQVAPWGEYGTALLVGPIANLPAGGNYQMAIPVDAVGQGGAKIIAEASSSAVQPQAMEREIQVLSR